MQTIENNFETPSGVIQEQTSELAQDDIIQDQKNKGELNVYFQND